MKIGVCDSGIGGLMLMQAIREHIPECTYVYYGDTVHAPFGDKTDEEVYIYTRDMISFLRKEGCILIVIACNTACAVALNRLQDEYNNTEPAITIVGIVHPTVEAVYEYESLFVLATSLTVASKVYSTGVLSASPGARIVEVPAPLLVPLIEAGDYQKACAHVIETYCRDIIRGKESVALVLGCTHYIALSDMLRDELPPHVTVVSQDAIIPQYVSRMIQDMKRDDALKEFTRKIAVQVFVSKLTSHSTHMAHEYFGVVPVLIQE